MKKKEQKLARVTSVLGWLNSSWKEYWWRKVGFAQADIVSRESQEFGKKVHKILEDYCKNPIHAYDPNDNAERCAYLIVSWMQQQTTKVLYLEQELKDTKIGLIGHTDLLAEINGEQVVIDYKTSRKIDLSYALQLAIYADMANKNLGLHINKGIVLRVDKDPNAVPQLEVVEYNNLKPYIKIFKNGLLFYRYMTGKIKVNV